MMSFDDEKWANIVGNDDDCNVNTAHMTICLKQIPPDELKSLRPIKATKKSKKNQYFFSDTCTTLSVEDIQYQLLNTSDTLNKKTIPDNLRKDGKLLDKFDKLVKTPGRNLSSKLKIYFSRNLKSLESSSDNFEISYKEIQDDVKRHKALRKQQRLKNLKHTHSLTHLKAEKNAKMVDMIDNSNNILAISNIQELMKPSKLFPKNPKRSFLGNIDNDFKPKMLLSTKTYTRKRKKT